MPTTHVSVDLGLIRAEMARLRLTQEHVAAALGITRTGFYRRMNAHVDFSATEVIKLAALLKQDPSALLVTTAALAEGGDAA